MTCFICAVSEKKGIQLDFLVTEVDLLRVHHFCQQYRSFISLKALFMYLLSFYNSTLDVHFQVK